MVWGVTNDCDPKVTLSNYQNVVSVLNAQATSIEKVLEGKPLGAVAIKDLFGSEFQFEKSEQTLTTLADQLANEQLILPQHQFVIDCLEKNNLAAEKLQYLSELKKLLELRRKLVAKNLELGNSILSNLSENRILPTLKDKLVSESEQNKLTKEKLEQVLLQTEASATQDGDMLRKEVKAFKGLLTKLKIDLVNKKISQNNKLEEKLNYFTDVSTRISEVISDSQSDAQKRYLKVEDLWLEVVNDKLSELAKTEFRFDLPIIPEEPRIFQDIAASELVDVRASAKELAELKKSTIEELTEKKSKEVKLLSELFIQVSKYRSALLKKLSWIEVVQGLFTSRGWELLRNEIYSAPFRLISYGLVKYHSFREKLSLGREGVVRLSLIAFFYLLVMGGLFLANSLFHRLFIQLGRRQSNVLRRFNQSAFFKYFIGLWNKLKDNFIPLMWVLLLSSLRQFPMMSDFILLIDLAIIYFLAIIFRSLILVFLGSIAKIETSNFREFKIKASTTAEKFQKIFLIYFSVVHILELSIGHLYLFLIFRAAIFIYSLSFVIKYSSIWEEEFKGYVEKRFSGFVVKRVISFLNLLPSRLRAPLIFFVIFFLSILDFFIKLTENFEISKKVSANLFKKQIEKIEAEEGASKQVPNEYKELFSLKSLSDENDYIDHLLELEAEVIKEVDEWVESAFEEHSIVIYGDKGIGKTTFLKHTQHQLGQLNENLATLYVKIPSKTLSKKNLQNFFIESFGVEKQSIMEVDKALEKKTVVFIDEAQNVFLSKNGGFDAYYELLDIINLNTENIFWVLSFNRYSWLYLDRAFGRTQYFRNVFELKGWSDSKIKELILTRHQKSQFKLSYDLLISATSSEDEIDRYSSVEAKFFKLLWELSRGNPRTALFLWITALSRKNSATFNVNIPKEPDYEGVSKMSDELMFVFAGLFKHENLSPREIELTTNLPKGIVRNSIKFGLEKRLIYQDERGRVMIDISAQHLLTRILKLRNFIYGN